ncbi:MAG: protein phosphatase 2C domain-containing protein [Gammaproteobacteria bacterium]|nr:protein phosphatase 2C domain-containing protein [Gammaproteobacteria bacterium]
MGRTDCGRVRRRNEDRVAADVDLGAGIVADGMGGLRDGHIASRKAVAAVMAHLRRSGAAASGETAAQYLLAALAAANEQVHRAALSGTGLMGTTAVAALLGPDGRGAVAHVGDSRAYHLRGETLIPLTRDHSVVQELQDDGLLDAAQARRSPQRNIITRAIGLKAELRADSVTLHLAPGDLLLLCSDGLWDMLEDSRIKALLVQCLAGSAGLAACAEALIDAANEAGGMDNISVVLARTPPA